MSGDSTRLDRVDRELLNALQSDFPLDRRPYLDIARKIGLTEKDVITRTRRLKAEGIIRTIGPVLEPSALGYTTTLVAARIPPRRLEEAAQVVSRHPGVSHNYQRRDYYNLWFTLSLPKAQDRSREVDSLRSAIRPTAIFELPALRLFKISAAFDLTGSGDTATSIPPVQRQNGQLTALDWSVIEQLQRDAPVTARPFDAAARRAGMSIDQYIAQCQHLKDHGVIRRYGAALRHRSAGLKANTMVAWVVPAGRVDEAGLTMSGFKEVSHCYERRTNADWPYNMFTMVHGRTRDGCLDTIDRISAATGIKEYRVLFSVREFKKERVRYERPGGNDSVLSYYPAFVDIRHRRCVVIGGGAVALRKVNMLREFGADVDVISPDLCAELKEMARQGTIRTRRRSYRRGDLESAVVVIAATDDAVANEQVADEAHERGILVNVVDVPRLSSFVVPSYVRRGALTLAISTSGKSPALARKIRTDLQDAFGPEYAELVDMVAEVRSELKASATEVPHDDWQEALDLDTLLGLLRAGRREHAKQELLDRLGRNSQ